MAQDFTTPIPPMEDPYAEPPKKNRTVLIVVIVVVVLLCCCCMFGTAGFGGWLWQNGDQLIEDLGVYAPSLISLT